MTYERFKISYDPWLMAKTANPAKEGQFGGPKLAQLAEIAISQRDERKNEGGPATPYEGFEGDQGVPIWPTEPFLHDPGELIARAELGGFPVIYARAFAEMQMRPPPTMSVDRWYEAVNNAGLFLDEWGATAEQTGWTANDLFGHSGLVWRLAGQPVTALDASCAIRVTGRRFDRLSSRRRAG